jgi:signal transduction histidine kinase
MRWPIRNQILLPLLSIQIVITAGVTCLVTWWSLERVETELQHRLSDLSQTVSRANFPLTQGVLEQLHGLSGAEFVLFDKSHRVLGNTLSLNAGENLESLQQGLVSAMPGPFHVKLPFGEYMAVSVPVMAHQGSQAMILYPEVLLQAARRDAITVPILFGIATLLLTSLVGIFVAQHIGKRMQAIERQVARVAQGDFQPIPLSPHDDELRDLSASVNRMGLALERLTSQIRTAERAQLIKQLTSGIAHQLRNSLTGARMAVQVHRRRCQKSDEESLEVALRQLTLTEEQIRGLGALLRDEHRERVWGVVETLAKDVVRLIRPMCQHRQIEFEFSGRMPGLMVPDADQIRAAILNLCINAIEATAAGGRVCLRLSISGSQGTIEVRDDGPGIAEELRQRLFDPFQTTKPEGMGLGLALARQAAEDHQGSVDFLREAPWTIFQLKFHGQRDETGSPIVQSDALEVQSL